MKPIPLSLSVMTSLALSAAAAAGEAPNDAYLQSPSTGRVVMDTYGNCVRTTAWSPEKMIEGCGKAAKPVPVAAPAAPPPVVAPAPRPPLAVAPPPAPPPAARPVAAAPKPKVRTVTLQSDALFAFNSAFFKREGQPGDLEKLAQRARDLSSVEAVHIVGHTDNIGSSAYNQRLSERRAASMRDFFVKSGIDPAKITIMGMGERSPVADNATRDGRARNRRVVIMFKGLELEK